MLKKTFLIMVPLKEYEGVYNPDIVLKEAVSFGYLSHADTKEECEKTIENLGLIDRQYIIMEFYERL